MGTDLPVIFITGATGFLGGAVVSHLLSGEIDCRILALVRGPDLGECEQRLKKSLARFEPRFGARLPQRIEIVPGDLTDPAWGSDPRLPDLTHVLHIAANTSFLSRHAIRRTNVEGSLAVMQAVRSCALKRYLHVGTAMICGGDPPEVVTEDTYPARNVAHLIPYTSSKAEAELQLLARAGDLPLVIARPSIVAGHTRLGCGPSGSIFWVVRAVEQLRRITWDLETRLDVIPVDYAARALIRLLLAPHLRYQRYHISAGSCASVTWREIAWAFSRLGDGEAEGRYQKVDFSDITRENMREAFGPGTERHMSKALELYYRFCRMNVVFDNSRLLEEGIGLPPKATSYLPVCLSTSPASVYQQMLCDA